MDSRVTELLKQAREQWEAADRASLKGDQAAALEHTKCMATIAERAATLQKNISAGPIDASNIRMEVLDDPDADTSWLEQDEFTDELEEYHNGGFTFVGVRATVAGETIEGYEETHTSAGLWGITSDSGTAYFREVFEEEKAALIEQLRADGFTVEEES